MPWPTGQGGPKTCRQMLVWGSVVGTPSVLRFFYAIASKTYKVALKSFSLSWFSVSWLPSKLELNSESVSYITFV